MNVQERKINRENDEMKKEKERKQKSEIRNKYNGRKRTGDENKWN